MLKDSEIGNIAAIGPAGHPSCSKYERLIADAKQVQAPTTVVVHPCEETALRGPIEAAEAGIIVPILVGPAAKIAAVVGTKDNAREQLAYLQDLSAAVKKAVSEGKPYADAQKEIKLPKYETWPNYNMFLPMNIERYFDFWNRGI
jgi:hypothetical protein